MEKNLSKKLIILLAFSLFLGLAGNSLAEDKIERRQQEQDQLQKEFSWWPTDAKPAPVKDRDRSGYWWWPEVPGQARPWGNRGYVYVYKIIYDYKEEELPPAKPQELRPSLLIKKIIKNVKVYFDYNKSSLRPDAKKILSSAVKTMERNPETSILITGNCDVRGSEEYNAKLGIKRGESVKKFMLDEGVPEDKIKIISRGKLDAVAPLGDPEGMQKDRNAQFMIAEVQEVMIPAPEAKNILEQDPQVQVVEEGKYTVEKEENVESAVKVSQREYTIKSGDSLWKIAEKEMGSGHRWKYLYEMNKNRISNPKKLKIGRKILIPVE